MFFTFTTFQIRLAKKSVKALTICTVSDSLVTKESTSADEREKSFNDMFKLCIKLIS